LQARWRALARAGGVPGLDRAVARLTPRVVRPTLGSRAVAHANPAARDLVRHAFADAGGQPEPRALVGALRPPLAARRPSASLLDAYAHVDMPVLLLWADRDALHPLAGAEEVLDLFPDAQLRVPSGHRLPDRLRRPGRPGTRARLVLRLTPLDPATGTATAGGARDAPSPCGAGRGCCRPGRPR
jgi:pimeloyl-ACP methyl ester carboxylesterase